jgi:glycosyltransferase involved in cell wall biosynthesis
MKSDAPTVSVVIPTRNRAHLVTRALRSVLNQSLADLEVIVVDDCSDDDTEACIRGLADRRIRYLRHAQKKGGGAARNAGIDVAKGAFIAFLDDDDEWLPEKLQRQVMALRRKPEVGMVYTGYHYVHSLNGSVLETVIPQKRGRLYRDLLQCNCVGTTSSPMVRGECLERVGGFDPELRSCQDWDLWVRISRLYDIDFVHEPLLRIYVHDTRISHDIAAKIQGLERFVEKNYLGMRKDKKSLSRHYVELGRMYYRQGEIPRGRWYLLQAVKENPLNLMALKYLFFPLAGPCWCRRVLGARFNKHTGQPPRSLGGVEHQLTTGEKTFGQESAEMG